jgi:hypothetical protein
VERTIKNVVAMKIVRPWRRPTRVDLWLKIKIREKGSSIYTLLVNVDEARHS